MLHRTFFEHAFERRESVCLVDAQGREWTFGEVAGLAENFSAWLGRYLGAETGVVGIISPNCAEYLISYVGAIEAGWDVTPMNYHLASNELNFLIENCEASVLVVHSTMLARVRALPRLIEKPLRMWVIGSGGEALSTTSSSGSQRPANDRIAGRLFLYTSATTGRPKGVVLPRANADASLQRAIGFHKSAGVKEVVEVHLCTMPLYHSGPLHGAYLSLNMGNRLILMGGWNASEFLRLVQRHEVTTTCMVPTMFVQLLRLPTQERSEAVLSSLKHVTHLAAACPPMVKRQMIDWLGLIFLESYGATEGAGTFVTSQEWIQRPGTVGRPIPGADIKIMDDEGNIMAPGETGFVYIKPYTGDRFVYKDDLEATARAYRGDYFCVGDLGWLDADGYLYLADRRTDLIVVGGYNVYPQEVENVILEHQSIEDCAVVGVEHSMLGKSVVAFVKLSSGVNETVELIDDLLAHLRARLAFVKIPTKFTFVSQLPRDPNGKMYRRKLRELSVASERIDAASGAFDL